MGSLTQRIVRAFAVPLISITAGLLVGALVLLATGNNPLTAYQEVFRRGFGCRTADSNTCQVFFTLRSSTPIILTSLAAVVAFSAGVFSIGMEGQYVLGGLAAAVVGGQLEMPAPLHIALSLAAGMAAGSAYAFIPAILKVKLGVNALIATVLLNTVAVLFFNYMINYPLRDDPSARAYTRTIQDSARLPAFDDASKFGLGFVIALAAAVVVLLMLQRTVGGFEMRTSGRAPLFARYSGMRSDAVVIRSMLVSGALAGLGGGVSVLGYFDKAIEGFDDGTGLNGLTAAILGGVHPVGAVLVSILFAGITYGAQSGLQVRFDIPREIGGVLVALIIVFVAAEKPLRRWVDRVWFSRRPSPTSTSAPPPLTPVAAEPGAV